MEEFKTKIIRAAKNSDNPYFLTLRSAIQDTKLSLKATGLLSLLLSFPDEWVIYVKDLANRKTDGKTAIRSGLRELESVGYLEKIERRGEDGRYQGLDYMVYENPRRPFPSEQIKVRSKKRKKSNGKGEVPWAEYDDNAMRRDVERSGGRHTSRAIAEEPA